MDLVGLSRAYGLGWSEPAIGAMLRLDSLTVEASLRFPVMIAGLIAEYECSRRTLGDEDDESHDSGQDGDMLDEISYYRSAGAEVRRLHAAVSAGACRLIGVAGPANGRCHVHVRIAAVRDGRSMEARVLAVWSQSLEDLSATGVPSAQEEIDRWSASAGQLEEETGDFEDGTHRPRDLAKAIESLRYEPATVSSSTSAPATRLVRPGR